MKMFDIFLQLDLSVTKASGTLVTFFQNLFIGKKNLLTWLHITEVDTFSN